MKKPMDDLKKIKLTYCGELGIFAVIFLVLGVLFLTGTISVAAWKKWTFSILTLAGGLWLVADLIWCLVSPTRRAKVCLLDKILVAPMGLAIAAFDVVALVNQWPMVEEGGVYFRYAIGVALCYYGLVYIFQAIYHWKYPNPLMLAALEEEEDEKKETPDPSQGEETK